MDHDFVSGAPIAGELPAQWIHGSRNRSRPTDPPVQVYAYNRHTYILRQSKDTTYEAPFVFLLFGNRRALLYDTGATADRTIRDTVDDLMLRWLDAHPRADYELLVVHSHGHGDHVAGDPFFIDRPATRVVAADVDTIKRELGFRQWPAELVELDLGGRILDVTGIPGHHVASLAILDRWTGILLTGDTVLPGRLYVEDTAAFLDSLDRLVTLSETRPVRWVLGCHIEMTREAGRDYPLGCRYQPEEAPLEFTAHQLRQIRDAVARIGDRPGSYPLPDAIFYCGMTARMRIRLIGRSVLDRLGLLATNSA
ncbi:MBL fold metallo-hydrolase [Jatrophihabitans telluris]|uniref:MBL fold metallo-hydrolase n=1 Tax=Jatrophihabitans telluris TaxID=2038343 RepID=A0ABY4QZ84_9ACTN|nr:MBL fold metallo-hydrolase [Jatrophihabitans telluris]UQX88422.1 MBL fold metallo-hydrolase [Jatrophihabitans telluris]